MNTINKTSGFKHLLALLSFSLLCFAFFFSQGMIENNFKDVVKTGSVHAFVDNLMAVQADDWATLCLYHNPQGCSVAARVWCKDPGKTSFPIPNVVWYDTYGCLFRDNPEDHWCKPGYWTYRCTTNWEGACEMGGSIKSGTLPNPYVATLTLPGGNSSSGQPYSAMKGPYVYNGTPNTGPDQGLTGFYGYYAAFVNRYYTNCFPSPTPVPPTKTPTPTFTITPTKAPYTFNCTSLTRTGSVQAGAPLTYTCKTKGTGITSIQFRTTVNGGTPGTPQSSTVSGTDPTATFTYQIPGSGAVKVDNECSACSGTKCTEFGRSDQVIVVPQ